MRMRSGIALPFRPRGIAIDNFVIVNDRASQEARFFVIVIDDHFQHEGADVVIVSEEAKDQTVHVIEPGAVEFAMSSARQLPYLSCAKIAIGNRGYHLAVGGLYPRSVQISEFEDLHGTTCFERFPEDRFAARIGNSQSRQTK